jgi:DNA-binding CsgD family transcriptional regulator
VHTVLVRGARAEIAAVGALAAGEPRAAASAFGDAAALLAGRAEPYALRARYGQCLAHLACDEATAARVDLLALEQLTAAAGMGPLRARIRRALRTAGTRRSAPRGSPLDRTTAREAEVLALVAEGATTAEIGRALAIAPTTVESLVASAARRLGVRGRRHAVAVLVADTAEPGIDLDRDEFVLLAALAGGASTADAARRAGLSLRTAHRRLAALRARLGARTTTEAIAVARQISTTTGRISGRFEARR